MHRTSTLLALGLLGVALQGCVIYDHEDDDFHFHDEPFPAELRLHWEFRGAFDCLDANVSDILIQIEGGGRFQEFGYIRCELGFVDIPAEFPTATAFVPGSYFVTVLGYPPRAGSPATWAADGWIELFPGSNEYTFRLSPLF